MNKRVFLGIDTSNYTTSLGIISESGELLANVKVPLTVKQGQRGLRQSDAVFAHTKNLPIAFDMAKAILKDKEILAIGVSEKPRNEAESYMPCFLSGYAVASSLADTVGVPLYTFSHQCGHIMAALYSCGRANDFVKEFAAFHISGGTTELVRVTDNGAGFETEIIGATNDISCGQAIDRIGVYMGLSFPAGAELEQLALENTKKIPKKRLSADGFKINLSGLENMACRIYDETQDKPLTASFVLDYIAKAIIHMSEVYVNNFGNTPIVYAGGVMSNSIIKNALKDSFDAYFAQPQLSSDNAVGIAALTLRKYKTENN